MGSVKRVFLIDDDEDDCYFFQIALESFDYPIEYLYERDSVTALEVLLDDKNNVPDLIFLDWNMPKLTGSQCLEAIKDNPKLSFIPIIIYTTSNANSDIEKAKSLGASFFLPKPTSVEELYKNLVNLFSRDWK